MRTHSSTHGHTHKRIETHALMCARMRTHSYTHVHTHKHTHTRMRTQAPSPRPYIMLMNDIRLNASVVEAAHAALAAASSSGHVNSTRVVSRGMAAVGLGQRAPQQQSARLPRRALQQVQAGPLALQVTFRRAVSVYGRPSSDPGAQPTLVDLGSAADLVAAAVPQVCAHHACMCTSCMNARHACIHATSTVFHVAFLKHRGGGPEEDSRFELSSFTSALGQSEGRGCAWTEGA